MLKRKLLLFCLLIAAHLVNAQYFTGVDPKLIVGQLKPASPEVTAMTRYSMSPPSFSNGLPQQNIPLFEIKENGISYSLGLFYSYSGFRVKEDAPAMGLGWGLTEGMITRVVKHAVDENTYLEKKFGDLAQSLPEEIGPGAVDYYFYTNQVYIDQDYNFTMNRLFYKQYDGQPDLYIYNFNGYSGQFLWINEEAVNLDHNDIVIEGEMQDNTLVFTLITPDGVTYTFHEADKTMITPAPIIRPMDCNNNTVATYADYGYTTAWRLKEIKNNLTQAKVTFKYGVNFSSQNKGVEQISSLTLPAMRQVDNTFFCTDFNKEEYSARTINHSYFLEEIESDNHKVIVNTNTRMDGGQYRIEQMQVFNKTDLVTPVKTIAFTHEYFGNTANAATCWLKLKKVNLDGNGEHSEYELSYVNESAITTLNFNKERLSIDHWGYFNNAFNTTLVPFTGDIQSYLQYKSSLFPSILSWANRTPEFTYSKYFALEKITYPTKGYTKINYQTANGRGIRVASQEDFDGISSTNRYYSYGNDLNFTYPAYYPYTEHAVYYCCSNVDGPHMMVTTFSSVPQGSLEFMGQSENFYQDVTEFIGTPDGQGGRTTYKYTKMYGYNPKTLLIETAHFKYGSTDAVSKEIKTYSMIPLKTINYWREPEMAGIGAPGPAPCGPENGPSCCPVDPNKGYILGSLYSSTDYTQSVWIRLASQETITDLVSELKTFDYRGLESSTGLPKHTFPVSVEETLSNGKLRKTYLYYPGENDPDNASITLGLLQMWDASNINFKNYRSPVVKSKTFVGTSLVSQETNLFAYDATNDLLLKSGNESLPAGVLSGKINWSFGYNSKAKIVALSKDNTSKMVYIWDYNNSRVIAEVTNAMEGQAAYTSFEADGLGGWSLNSNSVYNTSSGITGIKTLNGGVNKTVPQGNYTLGIWGTGDVWTNGQLLTQPTATVGVWNYYEVSLNNITSVEAHGSNIDEVRLHPTSAQMSTFIYDKNKRLTSQADARNNISYFEYDSYGRLKLIRDQYDKVLKVYDYQLNAAVTQ